MKQLIPSTLNVAALAFSLLVAADSHARNATPVLINTQLPRRPHAEAMDAQTYEREYRKAVIALEAEQHEFTGMWDFVKRLCLWFESPEERMRKNGCAVPEGIFCSVPPGVSNGLH